MIRQGKNGPEPACLKICGLTRAGDVAHCLGLGVAFVGFNLYPGSKRHVGAAAARALWLEALASVPGRAVATKAVGVVVDLSDDELRQALAAFPELAAVQFHGAESPETLAAARAVLGGRGSWKALGVRTAGDVSAPPRRYAAVCDLILLDNARIPAGAASMGGSGQAFDWAWIAGYDAPRPLGVAGGVNPDNVARLGAHPAVSLIDACSGVESAPGIKDPQLVDALCRIVGT